MPTRFSGTGVVPGSSELAAVPGLVVLFDLGPQRGKGDVHPFSEFAMGVEGRRVGVQNEVYEFATGVRNS
jgi:hypothetical protein